jgi:hypothetical protein
MHINKNISARIGAPLIALAIGMVISPSAFAENSEGNMSPEEQKLAQKYQEIPEAAKVFVAYLQDLDKRYPDSAEVDIGKFMASEGETLALKYCAANGIDGACAPADGKDGRTSLVALDDLAYARGANARGTWWEWLLDHAFNVGVIPETNACPAPYAWTQIFMDDEDSNNESYSRGWVGAIISSGNTTYRFCKLDFLTSLNFRPLQKGGDEHDYSVVNMGIFCPSGARRLIRVQENELLRNWNSSSGDVFPNFKIYNTWFNFYCHFDGGAESLLGQMNEFPKLNMPYGVFASRDMPAQFALAKGVIYQDDEDILNWNGWWLGSGDTVMWGSRNTERRTAKVR